MSVLDTLRRFLSRKDFWFKCNLWKRDRDFHSAAEILTDVFDGKVWCEFLFVGGEPLLAGERSLGVMLNVDWFQPFKLARYSVGVVYLVIMSLPRNERFKVENVIVVGIIPGPHEPSGSIKSYLSPLVDELLLLWEGCHVDSEIVIVVGIIPGPHEPSGSIKSYLSPLVDELLLLWEGCHVDSEIVKVVLLCVASDLPATRKVSRFNYNLFPSPHLSQF